MKSASSVIRPDGLTLRCTPIAMVHVHCTSVLLNHVHAKPFGLQVPTADETRTVCDIVERLEGIVDAATPALIRQVARGRLRSVVLMASAADPLLEAFEALPFVRHLVDQAVREVDIFVRNGFEVVEIENIAAPYFIGAGACPLEEILVINAVARAIRRAHPQLRMGVHILSCNELEVLPIAILHGAFFVRSEATLFGGLRPEGPTDNHSNLARFLYCRRVLRQLLTANASDDLEFPQVWSDVQKKHTIFAENLHDIHTWLHNICFVKLEGVIVTGLETGSDVSEDSLRAAREEVDKAKAFVRRTILQDASGAEPPLPVITGSGGAFEMYCKYADYIIVGTALKERHYWENTVSEENVKVVMRRIIDAQPSASQT